MTTKKADYIWFNGEMVPWGEAKVHVMSHALHYGTSVFEGIRCYDSHKGPVVFRHREHMQRLHDSAKIYRFPVSQSVDELMEACREVIRTNNLTSAYIRPLVFVGDVGMGVNPPPGYNTDVIIAAFPWGAYLGAEALESRLLTFRHLLFAQRFQALFRAIALAHFNLFVARIATASFMAYALGQILDVHVFNRLRQSRRWWLAPTASTLVLKSNTINRQTF